MGELAGAGQTKGWRMLGVPALGWCWVVEVRPGGALLAFALSSCLVAVWVANDDRGVAA